MSIVPASSQWRNPRMQNMIALLMGILLSSPPMFFFFDYWIFLHLNCYFWRLFCRSFSSAFSQHLATYLEVESPHSFVFWLLTYPFTFFSACAVPYHPTFITQICHWPFHFITVINFKTSHLSFAFSQSCSSLDFSWNKWEFYLTFSNF